MRKMITRTITETRIHHGEVKMENGVPTVVTPLYHIVVGKISEVNAGKLVRKKYGEKRIVLDIQEIESAYEISVEDFIKYATKVEPKKEEVEVTEEGGHDVN